MFYNDSFKNWVFDLDNTLYDIRLGLFRKISRRITKFIITKYNLSEHEAKEIQRYYYLKYGLTLRGLIVEKKLQPEYITGAIIFSGNLNHNKIYPDLKLGEFAYNNLSSGKFPLGQSGAGCFSHSSQ